MECYLESTYFVECCESMNLSIVSNILFQFDKYMRQEISHYSIDESLPYPDHFGDEQVDEDDDEYPDELDVLNDDWENFPEDPPPKLLDIPRADPMDFFTILSIMSPYLPLTLKYEFTPNYLEMLKLTQNS